MLARLAALAGAAVAASAVPGDGGTARAGCSPNTAWQDRHPSWASTVAAIVFQREEVGCAGAPNTLRSVSPTGTQPRSLGPGVRPSARADLVAFEHEGRIEVATTRGEARRILTAGYAPALSPQRDRIAFLRDEALWVMNLDGFDQRRLADAPSPPAFSQAYSDTPAWSPDGRIAFVGPGMKIFTVRADGTGVAARLTKSEWREVMPSWSPDGMMVAYATDRAGNWDVYADAVDGSSSFAVAAGPTDEPLPGWSPVDDRIAFV